MHAGRVTISYTVIPAFILTFQFVIVGSERHNEVIRIHILIEKIYPKAVTVHIPMESKVSGLNHWQPRAVSTKIVHLRSFLFVCKQTTPLSRPHLIQERRIDMIRSNSLGRPETEPSDFLYGHQVVA